MAGSLPALTPPVTSVVREVRTTSSPVSGSDGRTSTPWSVMSVPFSRTDLRTQPAGTFDTRKMRRPESPLTSNVPSADTDDDPPQRPIGAGMSASADAALIRSVFTDGADPPSQTTRPDALVPFVVTIITFDMSSPLTLSGTEPDSGWLSAPAPTVRVIVTVNTARSPSPLVVIVPADRAESV